MKESLQNVVVDHVTVKITKLKSEASVLLLIYSSPSLTGTSLLPNNSVLIRGVLWSEGVSHAFIVLAAKNLCPF